MTVLRHKACKPKKQRIPKAGFGYKGEKVKGLPRFGFRDTPKGSIKLDRKTGDYFFVPFEGKERRIYIGAKHISSTE